jgi:hypothetical protein
MKKSMFIGVLLGCLFAAGVLYYQLWMPITTMGKYACLASESVYDLDYYTYVREKVKTDFMAISEGYEYDAGKECKEVERKAKEMVYDDFKRVFDEYNHRQVIEYLGKRTGGKTKEEIYACYANKAVQEYSKLMQIAFDIEGKKVENETLIKESK